MDNYIEHWASIFKEIGHKKGSTGKEKRFYRIDSIFFSESWFKNLTAAHSPSVAFVTRFDPTTTTNGKYWQYWHRIFIFVKEEKARNSTAQEAAAVAAKRKGVRIAEQLLAYMHKDRKGLLPSSNGKENPLLKGLSTEASIVMESQMYDGWWPTEIIVSQQIPRNQCVDTKDYETNC